MATDILYAVALNGTSEVEEYWVVKETPKTYVLNRYLGQTIRKATMCTRWEAFFTEKTAAEKFRADLLYSIKQATKRADIMYIYKELESLRMYGDSEDQHRLKSLIKYVEEFL